MGAVKDELIEMQECVWYAFDHGFDIEDTLTYVHWVMGPVDETKIEEMYQDLKDEF